MFRIAHLAIFAALAAVSCTDGALRHEMRHMPQDGWRRQDTVTFLIDSAEAGARLSVCIRADRTMPYDTLWLRLGADTLAVPSSAFKGQGLRQCEYPAGIARPGRLSIIHLMRRAPLPGVREVGIKTTSFESLAK